MRNAAHSATTVRGSARGTAARLGALVASLALVAVLVQVPCLMGAETCALAPVTRVASSLCPMAADGGRAMKCCAKGEAPRQSAPATPAGHDSGQRLQLQVLPVGTGLVPVLPASPTAAERPAMAFAAIPAAPATPLYTLLSTLLS